MRPTGCLGIGASPKSSGLCHMKLKLLKKMRVIISLTFFLATGLIFLDLSFSIPEKAADFIVFFQFVPSLLKFISLGTLAASGFIVVIGLTLIFGRLYCSFFCPLGVLQDIITYIRHKIRKIQFTYKKPHNAIRYGILAAVVLIVMLGSIIGLTVLDPYSNFGRMLTNMARPVAVLLTNTLGFMLEKMNIYAVSPIEFKGITFFPFILSMLIFGLILWMALKYGRLYCNTICPVGTFLGLLSRFSLLKISFKPSECIRCKACEHVCKSHCMDTENALVDFSRCVACYNCLEVCPTSAVDYQWGYKKSEPLDLKDTGKRKFIMQTAAFFLSAGHCAVSARQPIEIYKDSTVPVIRKTAISPPGSLSLKNFTNKCTACHLCVSACPTQVLQPSFLEYGFQGIMQPRMDYRTSYCNYDCVICSNVCPTGAILKQSPEVKKLIQVGKAKFIKENCVVYTQKTDCGACAEHCPTKAVRMVIDEKIQKRMPKIDENVCVGCGACEFACPTKPYKAIYVESNPVHAVARKPKEEKIKEKPDLKEDFPF